MTVRESRERSATRLRRRWAALAVVPALLLSACVSVPSSGGVELGGDLDTGVAVDFDFLPSGPSPGATPEEILRGFLAATTAAQNNYRIARSFLADDVADVWNPYESTLVRAREGTIVEIDETTLTYSVPIVASVDAVGRYSVADDTATQTLPAFRFVQEDGEWRIAELGNGILISQQAFPSAFSQHTLFYWDAAFRNLVPDLRWFPSRSEVATRIVRAVLDQPTSWLTQGATVSAIPEGTALALQPVTVDAGIAQIDLTSEVLSLTDLERQRVRLQLAASLRAVSGVVGVQITVDQNAVSIPEWTAGPPDVVPQVDGRLLLRTAEAFGFATGGEIEPLGELSPRVLELGATAVALAPNRTLAAVLTPQGVWAVPTGDALPVLLDDRPGLIAPSIDGYQFVWSVPATGSGEAGAIRATELDGTVNLVDATLPAGVRIVSLAVSRENSRVLLMLDGSGGPRLVYAAITRDESTGVPLRLGELRDLPLNGDTAVGATWVDEVRIASITRTDEQSLVELHEIGGRSRPLGLPPEATQIVGG
ncbi:MAG: hypothetical protein RL499_297, partial [Actinomycetota bacterium]